MGSGHLELKNSYPIIWRGTLAGLVLTFFVWQFLHHLFVVDDAFITFRYIDQFLAGNGLVYNRAEAVEGYSNFLWLLLVLGPSLLGVQPQLAAAALGFVFGIATLALVYLFLRRRFDFPFDLSISAAALLAAFSPWIFWIGAGLESSLFSFLLLLLTYGVSGEWDRQMKGMLGLFGIGAALALTRPEGFAFGGVLFIFLVLKHYKKFGRILLGSTALFAPLLFHGLWRYRYYGDWFANTVHAKSGFSIQKISMGLDYLYRGVADEAYFLLIPLLVIFFADFRETRKTLPIIIPIAMYLVFVVAVGGDGLYEHRFLAHITPLIVLMAALAATRLSRVKKILPVWFLVLSAVLVVAWSSSRPFYAGRPKEAFIYSETKWIKLGKELRANWPEHLLLATNVAGKLPYFAQLETIDMLGLCDRTIATTKTTQDPRDYAGHTKANYHYLLERSPDIIYLTVLDGLEFEIFRDYNKIASKLQRTPLFRYSSLFIDDSFIEKYQPAYLRLNGKIGYNFYLKRGSLDRVEAIPNLKILEWRSAKGD